MQTLATPYSNNAPSRIFNAMRQIERDTGTTGKPFDAATLCEELTDLSRKHIVTACCRLVQKGRLTRVAKGLWLPLPV